MPVWYLSIQIVQQREPDLANINLLSFSFVYIWFLFNFLQTDWSKFPMIHARIKQERLKTQRNAGFYFRGTKQMRQDSIAKKWGLEAKCKHFIFVLKLWTIRMRQPLKKMLLYNICLKIVWFSRQKTWKKYGRLKYACANFLKKITSCFSKFHYL